MATMNELANAIRRGERTPFQDADRTQVINDELEEIEVFHEAEDGELIIRFSPDSVFYHRSEESTEIVDATEELVLTEPQ